MEHQVDERRLARAVVSLESRVVAAGTRVGRVAAGCYHRFFRRSSHQVTEFEIGGNRFADLRIASKATGIWNKAGRLTWLATMNGERVKVFECEGRHQADLLAEVSRDPDFKEYVPDCLLVDDRIIVVRWVEGESLAWARIVREPNLIDSLASLQARLHSRILDPKYTPGQSYLRLLKDRFERFKGILPLPGVADELMAAIEQAPTGPMRLSHPDLVPRNVVWVNGSLVPRVPIIIDNELLDGSTAWMLDLFSTYHSLASRERSVFSSYLRAYQAHGGSLQTIAEHRQFYRAAWFLRLMGSLLQGQKYRDVAALAMEYRRGSSLGHPLLQLS